MKKVIALLLSLTMVVGMLTACGSKEAPAETPSATEDEKGEEAAAPAAEGKVYYLNFKPEQDEAWQKLAEAGSSLHSRNRCSGDSCNSSFRRI